MIKISKAYFFLGLAVILLCAEGWWLAKSGSTAVAVSTSPHAKHSSSASGTQLALVNANVAQWHLFGEAAMPAVPLMEASLAISLEGIMGGDASTSIGYSALIRKGSGATILVRAGDSIAAGVVVQRIGSDSVIINNNGRLERLQLKKPPALFN